MEIQVKLPQGFMNIGVTVNNNLVADTNDSTKWDTLSFPLPKGKWVIKNTRDNITTLKRKSRWT